MPPSDPRNGASMASLSPSELAEKLEKSEAGRKKLRQAISLMQEKLEATEKVLKVNESLRQECEQERQRAEDEKKKAEEEKRLRLLLEKDSAAVKDQLAKVLQRLGALENRQKSDKKEVEQIRNEVKLSVQGVSAAAEAMNAMQSSFQTLEHGLLLKVNTAFEKANTATQTVKCFQQSLQSLENNAMKKVNIASEEARNATQAVKTLQQSVVILEKRAIRGGNDKQTNAETWHISKKIVSDIAQLFKKEKKSHRKIEHQLAALKTLLKPSQSGSLTCLGNASSPEKNEQQKSTKKEKHNISTKKEKPSHSRKRKLMTEDEPPKWIVNKKRKSEDPVCRENIVGKNEINKCHNIRYSSRVAHGMNSGYGGSLSHGQFKNNDSPSVGIGLIHIEHSAGLHQSNLTHLQSQDWHQELISREREESGREDLRSNSHASSNVILPRGSQYKSREQCRHEELRINTHTNSHAILEKGRQDNSRGEAVNVTNLIENRPKENKKLGLELSDEDLDDFWWPGDTTLLSPTLPEIPSPFRGEVGANLDSVSGEASCVMVNNHDKTEQNLYRSEICSVEHDSNSRIKSNAKPLCEMDVDNLYVGPNNFTETTNGCADTEIKSAKPDSHSPMIDPNPASFIERLELIDSDPKPECTVGLCHDEFTNIHEMQNDELDHVNLRTELRESEAGMQSAKGKVGSSVRVELNGKSDCDVDLPNTRTNGCANDVSELAIVKVGSSVRVELNGKSDCDVDLPNTRTNGCANYVSELAIVPTDAEKEIVESRQDSDVIVSNSIKTGLHLENQIEDSSASKEATPLPDNASDMHTTLDKQIEEQPFLSDSSIPHHNYDVVHPQVFNSDSLHEPVSLPDNASADQLGPELYTLLDKESREHQFDNPAFETVDKNTMDEINNFLDILLPMPLQHNACTSSHPCGIQKLDNVVKDSNGVISLAEKDADPNNNLGVTARYSSQDKEMFKALEISSARQRLDVIEHHLILQTEGTPTAQLQGDKGSILGTENTSVIPPANSLPKNPYEVCLIQAFDLEILEVKTKVVAACISVIELEGYFSCAHTDKEVMTCGKEFHLRIDNADIPIQYIACSLISIVVGLVKVESKEEGQNPKLNPIDSFIKVFIAFVRTVFRDTANLIFDSVFAQLGSFLNEGKIMVLTFKELECFNLDDFRAPRVGNDINYMSFLYSEATLEDVCAGSKVLAGLCQVLSCVNHLQNVVYELLGCCDKDTTWLLTVFSSFASTCGHTAFVVEADDLLGRAICSIIIELVISVEQEIVKSNETSQSSVLVSSMGLAVLTKALDARGRSNVEDVLLEAVVAIQYVLGSYEALISGSNPDPKEKIPNGEECSTYRQMFLSVQEKESSLCEENRSSKILETKDFPALCETTKLHRLKEWQRKYSEAVGALELISTFMGWEWTYNNLIIRWLWRIIVSGTVQVQVAGVMHVVNMLARIALTGGEPLPGMEELRTQMVHILHSTAILSIAESAPYFSFLADG